MLLSEPRWLRGLDWRLIALGGLIAAIGSSRVWITAAFPVDARVWITAALPDVGEQATSRDIVLLDLWAQATIALLVLVLGTALMNLERPRLPVPVRLAIAVVVGTLAPFLIMHDGHDEPLWKVLVFWRRDVVPWGIAAAAWYCLRRASASETALRASEIARRSLETAMVEARLRALQAQVEPHFLFNTLAHVRRLYRTEPVVARRMLASFASYLESALVQMRERAATLGREVDLVRAYLDVQQVRMGARLKVKIDVPDALRAHAYPPMMLISLAENAIKHGLDPLRSGGTIAIEARARDGCLEVVVLDTGRGISDKIGSGVGLANVRGRLAALFGDDARLSLTPVAPSGVRAVIRTPLDASLERIDLRTPSSRTPPVESDASVAG
ncbi:MAG TPA: histidine kinase [Casimicrobiaceae bacterium]